MFLVFILMATFIRIPEKSIVYALNVTDVELTIYNYFTKSIGYNNAFEEGMKRYYEFICGYSRYRNLMGVTDFETACRLIREDGWLGN